MTEDIRDYIARWRAAIDATLEEHLPPTTTQPSRIHEAMRYSVFAGGKRIRPILAAAAAEACGADPVPFLKPFAALELIHTYSLIHDDLPALDNDDLRRGRPTSHVVFGEAMAILAGDALLTEAFTWLSTATASGADRQLAAVRLVAEAVDSRGMIGGQVADLEAEKSSPSSESAPALLDFIHRNKTGKLITASVLLGGTLGGASGAQLGNLEHYGRSIGLAFQIVDDLLDMEESAETLGKTAGKDAAQGKLTWPAVYGSERARSEAQRLLEETEAAAAMMPGPQNYLTALGRYICGRRH